MAHFLKVVFNRPEFPRKTKLEDDPSAQLNPQYTESILQSE